MGFFSWECTKSKLSIPAYPYAGLPKVLSDVVMVLPDDTMIYGTYDGYGNIGNKDIYGLIAPFVTGNPEAVRGDLFTSPIISYEGVEYEVSGRWDQPIAAVGISPNEMIDRGAERMKTMLEKSHEIIKLVMVQYYLGETYNQLEVSENCQYQGYFYPPEIREHLITKSMTMLERVSSKLSSAEQYR